MNVYRAAHACNFSALCLSGGGIRSAAVSLGVIQALVDRGLFRQFDYLSTVSGGGYIGAWLSSWLSYTSPDGNRNDANEVLHRLGSRRTNPDAETMPLLHLRRYSSYLTPMVGLFSADTWTAIVITFRNILINWLILIPALIILIAAIKLVALLLVTQSKDAVLGVSSVCLILGGLSLGYKLSQLYATKPVEEPATAQNRFLWWSLLPATAAGLCFVWLVRHDKTPGEVISSVLSLAKLNFHPFLVLVIFGTVVYILALFVGYLRFWVARRNTIRQKSHASWLDEKPKFAFRPLDFVCWVTGVVLFASLVWTGVLIARKYQVAAPDGPQIGACYPVSGVAAGSFLVWPQALLVILGVPWFLLATLGAHSIYLLLRSSSRRGDVEREWLGRASGWHFIAGIFWMLVTAIVLLGPVLYCTIEVQFFGRPAELLSGLTAVSGTLTWFLGRSSLTPAQGRPSSRSAAISNLALAIAGPLFATLLVILLSLVLDIAGRAIEGKYWISGLDPWFDSSKQYLLAVLVLAAAVMLAADRFANINAFSLHAIYRNRLVRAFLGGGRAPHRQPDGFTDFDWDDDLRVASLWSPAALEGRDWRLFHVINMTLNLSAADNLAWQQRKAMPFTATPFHCGNADLGYRRSREYGGEPAGGPTSGGMSLGTAIAVSGAAISPNMGYHSSKSLSFVLAFLNVRLGCWLGNPGNGGASSYRREAPPFALWALLKELFGLVSAKSSYVYLSDGGHFENLGLYEMVRRRCKYIVVVDGAQDAKRGYVDLGNAVRKIWIDLGVRIRFVDAPLLVADEDTKLTEVPYFAIGRIEYLNDPQSGDGVPEGLIFYIKPVVRGDEEAADVIAYKRAHIAFPQQSTGDQWFDEPQLEAYRRLGHLMTDRTIGVFAPDDKTLADFDSLFRHIARTDPKTFRQSAAPEYT